MNAEYVNGFLNAMARMNDDAGRVHEYQLVRLPDAPSASAALERYHAPFGDSPPSSSGGSPLRRVEGAWGKPVSIIARRWFFERPSSPTLKGAPGDPADRVIAEFLRLMEGVVHAGTVFEVASAGLDPGEEAGFLFESGRERWLLDFGSWVRA